MKDQQLAVNPSEERLKELSVDELLLVGGGSAATDVTDKPIIDGGAN